MGEVTVPHQTDMSTDINQMAQFAMSQMWSKDPYGQYSDQKTQMVFPSTWAFPSTLALQQVASMATRTTAVSPPQRRKANPVPKESKDEAYYERRRKNNDSAKRSRENRRQKEVEYQTRAEILQQENMKLQEQVHKLQWEIIQLRNMLSQNWPINP